jgi:hypothetical protein
MNLAVYVSHLRHPALEPVLDLFVRINDEQIVRLTGVPQEIVEQQRSEIEQIMVALEPFEDLLPRLDDEALARLAEQEEISIEFWRRCCVPPPRLPPSSLQAPSAGNKPEASAPHEAAAAAAPCDEDDEDDEDGAFVLTIDEGEARGSEAPANGAKEADDSMDWGEL